MQLVLHKRLWLVVAVAAALSLAVGTAMSHEGREVGDYRIKVGWIEEPAYEGMKNGVEVRVSKLAENGSEGHVHGAGGGEAMSMSQEDEHEHTHDVVEAASPMAVAVTAEADPVRGVNVHIKPQGFTFTPENVNGHHVAGEGHAHVYVDGEKIGRVYTDWHHLTGLAPGAHTVRVTLNTNDHSDYAVNGEVVQASTRVTVPQSMGHTHEQDEHIAADGRMSIDINLEPDARSGFNLTVVPHGFTFAAQNVNQSHVSGEGHAHVYVNGLSINRLYGPVMHLDRLKEGTNQIRVVLNTNTHESYTVNGEVVEATAMIHVKNGGDGYGEDSHDVDSPDRGDGSEEGMVMTGDYSETAPVEGLESTLQVEVVYVSTGASRVVNLRADVDEPGLYTADLIPTAPGVYEFRVFGTIEGMQIDETFASEGGGGGFDDIQSPSALQFPEELASIREMESAVRGALSAAQQAQDAASADDDGLELAPPTILAIVLGALGAVLGLVAVLRRR